MVDLPWGSGYVPDRNLGFSIYMWVICLCISIYQCATICIYQHASSCIYLPNSTNTTYLSIYQFQHESIQSLFISLPNLPLYRHPRHYVPIGPLGRWVVVSHIFFFIPGPPWASIARVVAESLRRRPSTSFLRGFFRHEKRRVNEKPMKN